MYCVLFPSTLLQSADPFGALTPPNILILDEILETVLLLQPAAMDHVMDKPML